MTVFEASEAAIWISVTALGLNIMTIVVGIAWVVSGRRG